jgi:hypothetical protein
MTIHVRRQGRVCTVFLDEAERPMTIASAEDQPVGGFPLTFTALTAKARSARASLAATCTFTTRSALRSPKRPSSTRQR